MELQLCSTSRPSLPYVYGLPLNGKSLTDWRPWGEARAVVYPASVVDSLMVRGATRICVTISPHVASGRQAAGSVIGVARCGRNPVGHDGRSHPSQLVGQIC